MASVGLQEIPEVVSSTAQGPVGLQAALVNNEGISGNVPEAIV